MFIEEVVTENNGYTIYVGGDSGIVHLGLMAN